MFFNQRLNKSWKKWRRISSENLSKRLVTKHWINSSVPQQNTKQFLPIKSYSLKPLLWLSWLNGEIDHKLLLSLWQQHTICFSSRLVVYWVTWFAQEPQFNLESGSVREYHKNKFKSQVVWCLFWVESWHFIWFLNINRTMTD